MNQNNPFSVVKASEYSNDEILEYWVPLGSGEKDSFVKSLNPKELMPKYILGSKGCGKTHILRYYSFEGRKNHYKGDIRKLLKNDKYIASYSRLDGLSSMRFKFARGDEYDAGVAIYNYYFELFHSIQALKIIDEIISSINVAPSIIRKSIIQIASSVGISLTDNSIVGMINYLNERRIEIDKAIIEYSFTRVISEKTKPCFPFGSLMFEIPYIFSENIQELSGAIFIYVLDEYEKLRFDWQKWSLNTLVFEKKYNCTFWVGARKNGYTTKDTLTGEPIHEGHEFQPIDLDDILKSDEKRFKQFAKQLFAKRLESARIEERDPIDMFETLDETNFVNVLLKTKTNLKHWSILSKRLSSIGITGTNAEFIIKGLQNNVEDSPFEEKLKLFVFYQKWNKNKNKITYEKLVSIVEDVNAEYEKLLQDKNPKLKEKRIKFKYDLLAQLAEENNVKFWQFSGFYDMVQISDCNPRVFLTLMKKVVEDSIFRGVNPFKDNNVISVQSQYAGIAETTKWFLDDIEVYGKEKENLDLAMNHLLDYFYISRYCDKPAETSLCAFYYRPALGLSSVEKTLRTAVNEGFLWEVKNKRKDKSLGTFQVTYQINRLIAANNKLSIARRGICSFPESMLSALFDPKYFGEYAHKISTLKKALNAPFTIATKKNNPVKLSNIEPTLFDI